MSLLPQKIEISDAYPNPSSDVARIGFAKLWTSISEFFEKPEIDLPSATTCDIGGQLSTRLKITGTTTIASFGTNYRGPIQIRTASALTITHNSTTLICPGGLNITTAAGDAFIAWPKATSGTADGWLIAKVSFAPATASSQGVVELATDAEAQAGTDATRCVTPDNLGAVVLGLGQSWQNMTASRAVSTTYTNSTGRAILVTIIGVLSVQHAYLMLSINGSTTQFSSPAYASGGVVTLASALVPRGATYSVTPSSGSLSSITWVELR